MADGNGVLIVGEFQDGSIASVTGELLGVGRKLADALGEELSAVFLGNGITDAAKGAFEQGADKVYVADAPILEQYQPESYATILETMCKESPPNVVVVGVTYMGRDLAPRLACRLRTGLAMDCTELNIDASSKALIATRPVFGGKALADVDCGPIKPAMASVRIKSQEPLTPDSSRTGEVISLPVNVDPAAAKTNVVDMLLGGGRGRQAGGRADSCGRRPRLGQHRQLEAAGGACGRYERGRRFHPRRLRRGLLLYGHAAGHYVQVRCP